MESEGFYQFLDLLFGAAKVVSGAFIMIIFLFFAFAINYAIFVALGHVVYFVLKLFHIEIKPETVGKFIDVLTYPFKAVVLIWKNKKKIILFPFTVVSKAWKNRKRIGDYILKTLFLCLFIVIICFCIGQCIHYSNRYDSPPRGVPSRYWG